MSVPYIKLSINKDNDHFLIPSSTTIEQSGLTIKLDKRTNTIDVTGVASEKTSIVLFVNNNPGMPEGYYKLKGFVAQSSSAAAGTYGMHLRLGYSITDVYDYYDYGSPGSDEFYYNGKTSYTMFLDVNMNQSLSAFFVPELVYSGIDLNAIDIESVNTTEQISVLGNELSYDTMETTIRYRKMLGRPDIKAFKYGTPVKFYYSDDNRSTTFYIDKIKRSAANIYRLSCVSAIGLLDKRKSPGNVYSGAAFSVVLNEIIDNGEGRAFPYVIDSSVADIPIYGWLPYGTARNNLRQLLFATNVHITKDINNNLVFKPLDVKSTTIIPSDDIYNEGSEETLQVATKVTVTEHSFFVPEHYTDYEEELFNNTDSYSVENYIVKFSNAPIVIQSLRTTDGLTIDLSQERGLVNYCVVSGRGILYGTPYFHNTFDIYRTGNEDSDEYEVSIPDVTLISSINSSNVADNVMEYYSNRSTAEVNLKYTGERVGFRYTYYNSFKEQAVAYLAQLNKVYSSFAKASATFLYGYEGKLYGNAYNSFIVLTGTGTFSTPSASRIKVVIIGGGQGGTSGLAGHSGSRGRGGSGGAGGSGGLGGDIYEIEIANPQASYNYSCGTNGTGGLATTYIDVPNYGTYGTSTTFGPYNSTMGIHRSSGFYNVLNGIVYGADGRRGCTGGNGGDGGPLTNGDVSDDGGERNALMGESITYDGEYYTGGPPGAGVNQITERGTGEGQSVYHYAYATGGGGGGATVYEFNTPERTYGGIASVTKTEDYYDRTSTDFVYQLTYTCIGGKGGNGWDPVSAPTVEPTHYGCGGNGGHGGGGGGGNGNGLSQIWSDCAIVSGVTVHNNVEARSEELETYGTGGYGGAASDGTPGCVIVFY